ncbi:amidohydrolase family protein [bacterium]|nr:amidohydrolase family protein [bacterium]
MSVSTDWIFRVGQLLDSSGGMRSDQEMFIRDGIISGMLDAADKSEAAEAARRQFKDAKRVNLPESIMLPGLINSHHHAYSALARGIPVTEALPDFPAILAGLWWKLDRALDEESIRLSALLTARDSIRFGCTTIIDHHSSPSLIKGSLDLIKNEFEKFKLTALLCCEITDRNGQAAFKEAVDENLRFIKSQKQSARVRGMIGLHAPFTLSDESLRYIANVRPKNAPVHVHVAEDETDVKDAKRQVYSGPLARLHKFGLLDENALLVHGVHLPEEDVALAREMGLQIAHNPESNCNNHVGYADPSRFLDTQVLLGTDGMSSNMLYSLRFAQMMMSGWSKQNSASMEWAKKILFENPARYLSSMLERAVGKIEVGLPADFAVFPYAAPTPLTERNWMYHLVYGLGDNSRASWVFANGQPVLEDGVFSVVDEAALAEAARTAAQKLWTRFSKL